MCRVVDVGNNIGEDEFTIGRNFELKSQAQKRGVIPKCFPNNDVTI